MANELVGLDSAILDLLDNFEAIRQGLSSPRDGHILRAVAGRVVQQLEPVLHHVDLKHEARALGMLPGTAVNLKSEYVELGPF